MSTLKTTNIAHPSATGTNIVLNSDDSATFSQIAGGAITSGTSVASTSGTSIDFTGLPSWVKRITIAFNEVSTDNNSSVIGVQLGDVGGIESSGYIGGYSQTGSVVATTSTTTEMGVCAIGNAARLWSGQCTLSLLAASTNTWVMSSNLQSGSSIGAYAAGSKSLSDILDRVRLTLSVGNFDAGTINILYEG
jgi:hypothetical protein